MNKSYVDIKNLIKITKACNKITKTETKIEMKAEKNKNKSQFKIILWIL